MKDNILLLILGILAVVLVLNQYRPDLFSLSVPGQLGMHFDSLDGGDCCFEGQVISGISGSPASIQTSTGPKELKIFGSQVRIDGRITACSYSHNTGQRSAMDPGSCRTDPWNPCSSSDPYILSSGCDRYMSPAPSSAAGCFDTSPNIDVCLSANTYIPVTNGGAVTGFRDKLFTPFPLTGGNHTLSGMFCTEYYDERGGWVYNCYDYSGLLYVGPLICTDSPSSCESVFPGSVCVNGVCAKETVLTCVELGCPDTYTCEGKVCSKVNTVTLKPEAITCTVRPEICPSPNECKLGVCTAIMPMQRAESGDVVVKDDKGNVVSGFDLTMSVLPLGVEIPLWVWVTVLLGFVFYFRFRRR